MSNVNLASTSLSVRKSRLDLTVLIPILLTGLIILPVFVVASALVPPTRETWQHLWSTILPQLIVNTLLLLVGVGIGTLLLGVSLAWLLTAYDFPGKKIFRWLLILPIAIPAYIMGFIYTAIFDFAGPVQSFIRSSGLPIALPPIRSGAGAIVVMALVLYPYVFLLAKAGFAEQSGTAFEAGRVLGAGKIRLFFQLALPLARPSISAGVALALMEALSDFATVRYFNFPTMADGVLRVWHGLMDLGAASELAGLTATFSLILFLSEKHLRSRRAYHQSRGKWPGIPTQRLVGWRGFAAASFCLGVSLAAFGLPLTQLLVWAIEELKTATPRTLAVYAELIANSLLLSAGAAACAVAVAILIASFSRLREAKITGLITKLVTTGYSIPGAVIAVGILLPLSSLDHLINNLSLAWFGMRPGLILTGSLFGLIYAYTSRYIAVAFTSVDASMEKIAPNTVLAARALGAGPFRLIWEIKLPLMLPGIISGAILVFVDVMKELPITVILRPLGYDTLAIWVWQMAAESLWSATALPALAIVLAGLLPIQLLLNLGKKDYA